MQKYCIKIGRCTGLAPKGISGNADPYVKLKLGKHEKRKTKIVRQTLNPVFDEWFDYPSWPKNEYLVVSVWNANSFSTNDFMGQLQFEFPSDPTGHMKARLQLRPGVLNSEVSGWLELEIVNVDVKRAYQKEHGAGKFGQAQQRPTPVIAPNDSAGGQLLKRLRSGDDFTMVSSDGSQKGVMLYWSDYGGQMGELIWCSPGRDPATASERHRLAMHTVSDVFVGHPCPHSKLVSASPDRCLSFKGKTNQFDLVASTPQVLEAWLEGIKYLLTSRGKKVVQNDVSNENTGEKKKGRRLTVSGDDKNPTTGGATYKGEATKELNMMMEGCKMVGYLGDSSSPTRAPVFIFFSKNGGKFGTIFWCDQGQKTEAANQAVSLVELTDIYVGKQQPVFQHALAKDAEDQRCFSIISKTSQLHVEAASEQVMKDWMVGISHALTSTGRKVVLENEEGEKKATPSGRRFSRHFSVAVRSKSTHPGVLAMAKGAIFARFRQKKSRKDRSVKTQIYVFHSRLVADGPESNKANSGGLFWYEKKDADVEDEKKAKDRSCIPIHSITDIEIGKSREIFKTKSANLAADDCAMTIVGQMINKKSKEENFELSLEAPSGEVALEWMAAIKFLLENAGREVEPEPTAAPGSKSKRMSVVAQPKSADPFDMLGKEQVFIPNDLSNVLPESRPANPFGDEGGASWDPFPGQQQAQAADPFGDGFAPADPFGGLEMQADPFPNASGLGMTSPEGKTTATPAPTPAGKGGGEDRFFGGEPVVADPFAGVNAGGAAEEDGGLSRFLASINLSQLEPMFTEESVDMDSLKLMTAEDLKDMGIKAGPRIKISKMSQTWKG